MGHPWGAGPWLRDERGDLPQPCFPTPLGSAGPWLGASGAGLCLGRIYPLCSPAWCPVTFLLSHPFHMEEVGCSSQGEERLRASVSLFQMSCFCLCSSASLTLIPTPLSDPGISSASQIQQLCHLKRSAHFPNEGNVQTDSISLQLLFSHFSKIKTLFQHQHKMFFFPISEIPQGIPRKMEIFARHPKTQNWVVSSFHLVQPLLPALWDESPSRSDKDS